MYIILDTSFHETGPYYLGEVYIVSLHGECSNEENVLLESGGAEFIELEKTEWKIGGKWKSSVTWWYYWWGGDIMGNWGGSALK